MKSTIKYIAAFVLLAFTVTSCSEEILDKSLYGISTSENFYSNEIEMTQAMTECYYQIKGVPYMNLQTAHFFIGDISTDDTYKGGGSEADFNEGLQIQNFTNTADNAMIKAQWSSAYKIINSCNIVIEKAPQATGDKELLERFVKEAKFLRAWSYYKLVTSFGRVPIILEALSPDNIIVPQSTPEQVFEQIYKDLNDATSLPARSEYSDADMGRATSGAAWALMARAYLFQKNFLQAENALGKVVTSGEYSLNEEFGWNFENEHKNGPESVFEVQFQELTGHFGTGNQLVQFFQSRSTEGGYGFHLPTQDLWDEYDVDDPRLTYTFVRIGDRFKGDNYDQDNAAAISGYHNRKIYVKRDELLTYNNNVSKNWVVIRYADVLLMYAEALNENGKSAEALTYLNAVRERARNSSPMDPKREKQDYIPPADPNTTLPDITTTDRESLREIIWKERRMELALEGHRRNDLIRQDRFGTVMRAFGVTYDTDKGRLFDDERDNLLPIPLEEIILSQRVIEQNPGF